MSANDESENTPLTDEHKHAKKIMNTIADRMPGLFLFVAKSESGKTHLIRYLITKFCAEKKFAFGMVLTGSAYNHE
jgi:hypothetical protein